MASILEILPAELISAIIDSLAAFTGAIAAPGVRLTSRHRRHFFVDINACSLTCHAFLPHCRKHIFKSIELVSQTTSPPARADRTSSFASLLTKSPIIAEYVQELHFRFSMAAFYRQDEHSFMLLSSALQPLKHLTYIAFLGSPSFSWQSMQGFLRQQVLQLISLPTVETIKVEDIVDFQLSDLLHRPKLKALEFTVIAFARQPDDFEPDLPQSSNDTAVLTPPPAPWELEQLVIGSCPPPFITWLLNQRRYLANNGLTFGLEGLKSFSMIIPTRSHVVSAAMLLQNTPDLQDLRFELYPSVHVSDLVPVVWFTPLNNMRSFSLNITNVPIQSEPLTGITELLQQLAHRERLQIIKLKATVYQEQCSRTGDEWGGIERVLLDGASDEWPSLVQFDFEITLCGVQRNPGGTLLAKEMLINLPRTQFRRISAVDSGIAFNFRLEELWLP